MISDRVGHFKKLYNDAKIQVDEEDREQIMEEASKRDSRILNLLDMKVVKRRGLGREGDFLLVPMYDSEKGEKIASTLRLKTRRRIRLDKFGWSAWKLIDGKRDVRKIGEGLREEHGEEVEPIYPRLSKFLAYLDSLKLIKIKKK